MCKGTCAAGIAVGLVVVGLEMSCSASTTEMTNPDAGIDAETHAGMTLDSGEADASGAFDGGRESIALVPTCTIPSTGRRRPP
jgi:hypothetical protein